MQAPHPWLSLGLFIWGIIVVWQVYTGMDFRVTSG